MQRENKEFNASGDIAKLFPLHHNLPCLAKLGARRHIILKERLMAAAGTAACATGHLREIVRKSAGAWHIRKGFGRPRGLPPDASFMTLFSTAHPIPTGSPPRSPGPL